MALPLKSGADLYNNQALRLRLHNLGADPTEVGAGLIYFNTSTGLNTSQKARLYTGSAWKTIAFSEDLDVASNADFLALKERVDLLSGEVDTDAIISNMKEVSAFLEGFAEDASLMDYLNTELGKKLDLTGGVMKDGAEIIWGSGATKIWGNSNGLFLSTPLLQRRASSGDYHVVLDAGNYSDYALPLSGGTIEGRAVFSLKINFLGSSSYTAIPFYKNGTMWGALGMRNDEPIFINATNDTIRTLIHSGNIGEQSVNYATSAGNADTLGGWHGVDILPKTLSQFRYIESNADLDTLTGDYAGWWNSRDNISYTNGPKQNFGLLVARINTSYFAQLAFGYGSSELMYRSQNYGSSGTTEWRPWKTIAFTDSNVASAQAVLTSDNKYLVQFNANTLYIGGGTYDTYTTNILGKDIRLRYGANASFGFWLNESGNVTIGASDLAGTDYKLFVHGKANFISDEDSLKLYTRINGSGIQVGRTTAAYTGGYNCGLTIGEDNTNLAFIAGAYNYGVGSDGIIFHYGGTSQSNGAITIRGIGGNVGIGTSYPTEKLHVVGNLHVTGNIIADGEVSAGGAAEEGGTIGGGGAFHSESIAVGATQTTIAHGLGTDDIVVSIYEKDGVSGRWSIILTDVEIVDANNIIVSFGSATNVEHKVVIMGAVA